MRHIAWSYDGGQTWEDLSVSEVLPDGAQHTDYGLMAGLVRLPVEGHDILLFSNIDVPVEFKEENVPFEQRTSRRIRGTVWASFDGGKTWPVNRLADEGSFAYSSIAAGRKGTPSEGMIYLFYESNGGAKMARFNMAWVTNGKDWKTFVRD
jgi:sialidase-1